MRILALVGSRNSRLIFSGDGGILNRQDTNEMAPSAAIFKSHYTIDACEKGIIFSTSDVLSGLVARAALAD